MNSQVIQIAARIRELRDILEIPQEEVAKKRKEQEEKRKAAMKKSKNKSEEKKEPVAATIETTQADVPEKPMQEQLSLI